MAKELTFQVQDMSHGVVRTFTNEPFLHVCRRFAASGVRYVEFIWPYQDAMLNELQLSAWLEDFPGALDAIDLPDQQRVSATTALAAAEEAVELSGYLLLQG